MSVVLVASVHVICAASTEAATEAVVRRRGDGGSDCNGHTEKECADDDRPHARCLAGAHTLFQLRGSVQVAASLEIQRELCDGAARRPAVNADGLGAGEGPVVLGGLDDDALGVDGAHDGSGDGIHVW